MSAPAPRTVKTPPASLELPANPTLPMSRSCHVGGETIAETLSKVPLAASVLLWLVTARPTYTVAGRLMLTAPRVVRAAPSAERYAVSVAPVRTSRTHAGPVPARPVVTDVPFVALRYWNARPLPGV